MRKTASFCGKNRADDDSKASTERLIGLFWTVQAPFLNGSSTFFERLKHLFWTAQTPRMNGSKRLFHRVEQSLRTVLKKCSTLWNTSKVTSFRGLCTVIKAILHRHQGHFAPSSRPFCTVVKSVLPRLQGRFTPYFRLFISIFRILEPRKEVTLSPLSPLCHT